jgi:hypothetical protein
MMWMDSMKHIRGSNVTGGIWGAGTARVLRQIPSCPRPVHDCALCATLAHIQETDAWIRALFELVPMLDKEVLKSEVLSMALSKGDMEENIGSRVICARILGAISTYLVGN